MASPNTLKRRATESRQRPTYLGPYNTSADKDDQRVTTKRDGWTPGKVIIPRGDRRVGHYEVGTDGALYAADKVRLDKARRKARKLSRDFAAELQHD